jgi:hypothetical protein
MKVYKKSKYNILYINILLQGRVIILCTTCRAKTQKSLSDPFPKEYFFEGMYSSSSSNADGEESEVGIDSNSSTSEDENAEMVLISAQQAVGLRTATVWNTQPAPCPWP